MMQFSMYEWMNIIIDIFSTYIIYKFMVVFFDTRKSSRPFEFLTYVLYYITGTIMFLFYNIPVALLFFNLIAFFALTFNYESTLKKRILSAVFIYLILAVVEILTALITGYLDFSLFTINTFSSVYGMIACRIVSFAVVLIMNNFKNIKRGKLVPTSNWLSIVLIPVASLYVNLLLFQAQGIAVANVMVGVVLIWIINFATFYLYDVITAALSDKMQSMLVLEQNKYYDKQLETIKTSLQTTSAIRHDLKNHMFSIRSLIERGDTEESLNYISNILEDIGTRKDYSATGNTVVDSIINFKVQEAEQRNIRTDLELRIPEKLDIPAFDMTIILGNLLDNAVKASNKVRENRFIHVKMKYDKGRLMIQVNNPYVGKINEENGRILTTDTDKENHGIGLQNISKVLQKYNGTMDIDYRNNIFSVSVLLYLD